MVGVEHRMAVENRLRQLEGGQAVAMSGSAKGKGKVPLTLHRTPCSLHLTPCTSHPTACTPHPTLYVHPSPPKTCELFTQYPIP